MVTLLVVTREGDRRSKLRPSQRAVVALVYLREHTTLAKIAAGFRITESTTHAYTRAVVDLPAERAPGLLKTLRERDPDFVLLDDTLPEYDRVGDGRADYSHKRRRHGVNVQVVVPTGSSESASAKVVPSWLISPTRAPGRVRRPESNASRSRNSLPPRRPSTGHWSQHEHPWNAVSRT
ncbi:Helix-turn-helix of DDE superfamily endonuclease [Streptomyces sp. MnatMP-M77]|nr:Helix-turn-helix of DDE superfamily endonuclease [Streptomyces sp. MnatMP-M77]